MLLPTLHKRGTPSPEAGPQAGPCWELSGRTKHRRAAAPGPATGAGAGELIPAAPGCAAPPDRDGNYDLQRPPSLVPPGRGLS